MNGKLHRLPNGVTLAINHDPAAKSASVGLYAGVGSRSEPVGREGLAHLVEHIVFKGAGSRDARGIAEAIEDVGGALNAWTARDQTVFHARILPDDVGLALGLIADLVRAPKIDPVELEREKGVILSEIGESLDAPDDLIHDRLFEAAFSGQRIGHSVLGSAKSVRAADREDCVAWLAREYQPSRLVIAAAGKVDEVALLSAAEGLFGDLVEQAPPTPAPATFTGETKIDARPQEQAHIALAWRGLPAADPAAPALSLFSQAVGGGMSSRLFQDLREERGLAYSIYSWTQGFADTGLFAVNMAAERERADEALALAIATVEQAADTLSEAELARARKQVEAGLVMALEPPQGRADSLARSIEVFGRILTVEEMLAELNSVTVADARAAAAAMLDGPRALASIGAALKGAA